jgi:hypothetical protein
MLMDIHHRRIMMPLEGLHRGEEGHRRITIIVGLPTVPIGKGEDEVDLREEDHAVVTATVVAVAAAVAAAEGVATVPTTTAVAKI